MAKQEDVDTMVEFGFAGYRGLHGSPNRRPSEIVEKILNTLVQNDKELRRRNSCQSWSTSSSFIPGVGGIPSRFRVMDPRRKTFQSIVEEVRKPRKVPKVTTPSKRSFKNVAQTVLLDDKLDEDLENDKYKCAKCRSKHPLNEHCSSLPWRLSPSTSRPSRGRTAPLPSYPIKRLQPTILICKIKIKIKIIN